MSKNMNVGIGDMKIGRREGTIITYALGSCIGITFYDPMIKLGALLHIMLPEANGKETNPYKFADTGIRETLAKLAVFGGVKSRYVCKIAGGGQMFAVNKSGELGNIGQRNIDSVKMILRQEGIKIKNQDVGGSNARTMLIELETGTVKLRTIGKPEIIL